MAFILKIKDKDVKTAVDSMFQLAAEQLTKSGSFKLAGMFNMKLKVGPAKEARRGVNPFTKEPCLFKAKPASKTVHITPTKKFKDLLLMDEAVLHYSISDKVYKFYKRPYAVVDPFSD